MQEASNMNGEDKPIRTPFILPPFEDQVTITKYKLSEFLESENPRRPGVFTVDRLFGMGDNKQFNISKNEETFCLEIFPYFYNPNENDPWRWKCTTLKEKVDRDYVKSLITWLFNAVYRNPSTERPEPPAQCSHPCKKIENVIRVLTFIVNENNAFPSSIENEPLPSDLVSDMDKLKIGHGDIDKRLSNVEKILNVNSAKHNQRKRSAADRLVENSDTTSISTEDIVDMLDQASMSMSDSANSFPTVNMNNSLPELVPDGGPGADTIPQSTPADLHKRYLESFFRNDTIYTIYYTTVTVNSLQTCTVEVDESSYFECASDECDSKDKAKTQAYLRLQQELESFYNFVQDSTDQESVFTASTGDCSVSSWRTTPYDDTAEIRVRELLEVSCQDTVHPASPPEVHERGSRPPRTPIKETIKGGCKRVTNRMNKSAAVVNNVIPYSGSLFTGVAKGSKLLGNITAKPSFMCTVHVKASKTLYRGNGTSENEAAWHALSQVDQDNISDLAAVLNEEGREVEDDISALTDIHQMDVNFNQFQSL